MRFRTPVANRHCTCIDVYQLAHGVYYTNGYITKGRKLTDLHVSKGIYRCPAPCKIKFPKFAFSLQVKYIEEFRRECLSKSSVSHGHYHSVCLTRNRESLAGGRR